MQTAQDIPVLIFADSSASSSAPSAAAASAIASERRINPAWTVATLKTKLLSVTGIPPAAQALTLRLPHVPQPIAIASADEEATTLAAFPLQRYAEIHVVDTRPASARLNLTDASEVDKWEMPPELYEKRTDSVLAWKKRQQLGRFDPSRQQQLDEQERLEHEAELMWRVVHDRAIEVGKRCRVGEDRRGVVRFVGPVPEIPNGGVWVGFEADEPTGKNDGSVGGKAYFTCAPKHGSFVRPERVEVGDFPETDDFDEEM